jgi:putative tryptophan/tyrosine transport system substrate-binding protein
MIGWLNTRPGLLAREVVETFRRGLAEFGFSDGRDVTVEYHAYVPALAADLVRRRPAAIIALAGGLALAAKAATRDIPIIFAVGDDPVELGLVASLNCPGGNLTGVTTVSIEIAEKRLELLHQAVPTAKTTALLVADFPFDQVETRHMQSAIRALGLRLMVFNVTTNSDITQVFATLVEHQADAIVVGSTPQLAAKRYEILAHAARFALPTMFAHSIDAQAGALLSYGPDFNEIGRQMGAYAGRILKGEKPADLPVVQPTKFEFVINLKAAKALSLTIPPNLLALADEVIE